MTQQQRILNHEMPPDECVDKADKYGSEYRGTVSVTKSGLVCQRWDSQSPNVHRRTPERHPDSGLQENYCRNPGGVNIRGIWCLNGEGTDPVLELCDIPTCSGADETEGEEEAEGEEISSSLGMSIPALPLAFAILRL
ncbi:plasminogen-like [Bolinopsis microptera]|uniref:plasminogen-like n=1 Tax=Bolinopsis microptera TaxID=2820187 RepID=UPI00307B0DF3